jgi:hypothetical protein
VLNDGDSGDDDGDGDDSDDDVDGDDYGNADDVDDDDGDHDDVLFCFSTPFVVAVKFRAVLFYDGLFASREFVVLTSIINLSLNEVEVEIKKEERRLTARTGSVRRRAVRCWTNGDSINILEP